MADKYESAIAPDGTLRYLSPSQITTFAPEFRGCPRKWFFEKRLRQKRPESEGQRLGTEVHRHNETWLLRGVEAEPLPRESFKTDAEHKEHIPRYWKALALFRAGKWMLPPRGPELRVESELTGVTAAGINVIGRIDLIDPRPQPVKENREPDPAGTVTVKDWKTSKDPKRYAKTAGQLRSDPQMLAYAYSVGAESTRLVHGYYNTQGTPAPFEVSALVQLTTVKRDWHTAIDPIAGRMKEVAKATRLEDVPPNVSVCGDFGGCPFRMQCPLPTPGRRFIMGVLDKLSQLSNVVQGVPPKPAVPAPAAPPPAPTPTVAAPVVDDEDAMIAALQKKKADKAKIAEATAKQDAEIAARAEAAKALAAKAAPIAAVLPPDAPKSDPELASECPNCPGKQHKRADCPALKAAQTATAAAPTAPAAPVVAEEEKKTRRKKADEPAPTAPAGLRLFVNCFPVKGPAVESLDAYVAERTSALAKQSELADIRTGDDKHPLGFGKWKGYLAAIIRESPPKVGCYLIDASTDIGAVVLETLLPMAVEVVRGQR